MALAQVLLHAGQQGRRHLGIGQRPVGTPRGRQVQIARQIAQAVAGRLGVDAARQQHGAGKQLGGGFARQRQLGLPELAVERCVVGHHGRSAHKAGRIAHHLGGGRRRAQHGIGDAGELGDEGRNPGPGLHQALETVHHAALLQQHDGHLGGPGALGGRHARGFEVDDGNRSTHHCIVPWPAPQSWPSSSSPGRPRLCTTCSSMRNSCSLSALPSCASISV